MSPARAGAFNANFAPDTLTAFKLHCKTSGKQYTKVLERLAEMYLESDGAILSVPTSPPADQPDTGTSASSALKKLVQRVQEVERDYVAADDHLETLLEELTKRVDRLEK